MGRINETIMIGYVKGEIVYRSGVAIIVDNNGIGYNIRMSLTAIDRLPGIGEEVKIYTYTYVKEDAFQLFGFLTMDELSVFRMLITVSGIGPRGGLNILSVMTADELRFAVLADDAKAIAKAPGIGGKTAGKLIIELKDKLKIEETIQDRMEQAGGYGLDSPKTEGSHIREEARQALTALGYSGTEAMKAVRAVAVTDGMTVEELLKQSLKNI